MSYQSKRTITSMAAGIILLAAYIIYATGKNAPGPDNFKAWALLMLIFIGIGIVALIIIQIFFNIAFSIGIAVKEQNRSDEEVERIISSTMAEDERDKLISMKAARGGYMFAGIGFVGGLTALALGAPAIAALHIMSGAFAAGSILEGGMSVYLYEKGVRNG